MNGRSLVAESLMAQGTIDVPSLLPPPGADVVHLAGCSTPHDPRRTAMHKRPDTIIEPHHQRPLGHSLLRLARPHRDEGGSAP